VPSAQFPVLSCHPHSESLCRLRTENCELRTSYLPDVPSCRTPSIGELPLVLAPSASHEFRKRPGRPSSHAGPEEARPHEQLRLELALAAARMGTWDWELDPAKMSWDRQMHVLFGLPPALSAGATWTFSTCCTRTIAVASPANSPPPRAFRRLRQRVSRHLALGCHRAHLALARPVTCDAQGKATRVLGVSWEVTDRRRTEADLDGSATSSTP